MDTLKEEMALKIAEAAGVFLGSEGKASRPFSRVQRYLAGVDGDGQPRPPTHDEIAARAYEIYTKTGRIQGQCKQNWQEAEQSRREQAQSRRLSPGAFAGTDSF